MGFKYYCTNCAAEVDASTELFDMQKLLLGNTLGAKLQILKFRLTGAEVVSLYNSGTDEGGEFRRCAIPFSALMGYIGNRNNLNVPEAATLTRDQLNKFLGPKNVEVEQPAFGFGNAFGGGSLFDDDKPKVNVEEKPAQKDNMPEAIQKMIEKDATTDSQDFAEGRLREDLQILNNCLDKDGNCTFSLKLEYEQAVDGTQILNGMVITDSSGFQSPLKNRVCPKCGAPVFKEAGTAEHKSVVFIGSQSSGKTSTILAMTHYAGFHMVFDEGNPVWNGAACLTGLVDSCDLLTDLDRLNNDLNRYHQGYAPPKTEASKRTDAYSATFFVSSMKGSRKRILTLTDLPGELCLDNGTLDTAKILNNFPVAMACDTFVVCFDTTTVNSAARANAATEAALASGKKILSAHQVIKNTCDWADEFQKLLVSNGNKRTYVPAMLLFTKCPEVESGEEERTAPAAWNAVRNCYLFRREEGAITGNNFYKHTMEQFQQTKDLSKSFHAVLRSSPYGYPAPAYDMANKDPELKATVHAPTPKNVDSLMRWVLMVSGCIPVTGDYRPRMGSNENAYALRYFIDRPQFRMENPKCTSLVDTFTNMNAEAMARCILFANPGSYDMDLVRHYRTPLNLLEQLAWNNKHMVEDSNDQPTAKYR